MNTQEPLFALGAPPEKKPELCKSIYVHFESREDEAAFGKLINQTVNLATNSLWYPEARNYFMPLREMPPEDTDTLLDSEQSPLFDAGEKWDREWKGMPEFVQPSVEPYHTIIVSFRTREDAESFSRLVGQKLNLGATSNVRSIWYPEKENEDFNSKRYVGPKNEPTYPIYVISKGRAESRMTSRTLEWMKVPYRIVVEPQERSAYEAYIAPEKILTLPFSNLGLGSIPARNWVWEHALASGAKRHWILDDNINRFYRLNRNTKIPVPNGAVFRAAEEFVDRYENVALAGFQYEMFASRRSKLPAFYLNSRIYSCILIQNDLPYRWRGRYNEDTDLSLRALKDGFATILFAAFLAKKRPTMEMKGGNTDELYKNDGRLKMAESLRDQHPDVTKITRKWGRWQHQVDYSAFRGNRLKRKPDAVFPEGTNEFGLVLKDYGSPDREWEKGLPHTD